jgi:hypothetical protein
MPRKLPSHGLLIALAGALAACEAAGPGAPNAAPAVGESSVIAEADSLLHSKNLDPALKAILAPLTPPIRLMSIVVLPSQLILQVQNSQDHAQVLEFRYKEGKVQGPNPVKLLGKGTLKDNLFNLEAADPHVAGQVMNAVRSEYPEPIRKLVMVRNLPSSLDIQFRAYLRGKDGDLVIAADKQGKVLGPIVPQAPN